MIVKQFSNKFREQKFSELKDQQIKIQNLMGILQNPVPIAEIDMDQLEVDKNNIINNLNKIVKDMQYEYEKLPGEEVL